MPAKDITLSRILSYIFHPLLIPILATSALMLRPDLYSIVLPVNLKIWFLTLVVVFTLIIPVAGVFILLKFNTIYSLEMNHRFERTIPLLIACSSYMVLLFSIKTANIPPVFLYVLYSATFALITGLVINLMYKISLHTLGWSALAATLTSVSLHIGISLLVLIVLSVLISGIIGSARLKQNAHNQTQIYLGYVAGAGVIFIISFFG